jgi:aspartokinase/homoserine dehydrogenase 1
VKNQLQHIKIKNFTTELGAFIPELNLSYQVFGKELGTAPIILINHALTGNSDVAGKEGWWQDIVGEEKGIDTAVYSILSFNIPGNGFDGFLIENYKDFIARDMASGVKHQNYPTFFTHCNRLEVYRLVDCQLPNTRTIFGEL